MVATKIDKMNRRDRERALAAFASGLRDATSADVPLVPFSATTGEGLDAVWATIHAWAAPTPEAARRGAARR